MKESIFYSALRAFFVVLLSVLGFCIALFLIALSISLLSTSVSNEPTNKFSIEILADADGKRKSLGSEPVILRINLNGIIGLDGLEQEHIRTLLVESQELLESNQIKGVLLYMQTPGGTVLDADGIYRAIKNYKKQYKVPVYAYVDGMCASGGMYIAAAADKILASDVSIIGSIGVIAPSLLNVSQLLDKVGVQSLTLYAGKGKDDLNPLRPWKPGEESNFQDLINYYYNDFLNILTSNRPQLDKTKLIKDYGAKVFPAEEAKFLGLIDESGAGIEDAIRQLVKEMKIEDNHYRVVQLYKETWLTELFKSDSHLLQGTIKHQLKLPAEYDPKLLSQFQYMYRP